MDFYARLYSSSSNLRVSWNVRGNSRRPAPQIAEPLQHGVALVGALYMLCVEYFSETVRWLYSFKLIILMMRYWRLGSRPPTQQVWPISVGTELYESFTHSQAIFGPGSGDITMAVNIIVATPSSASKDMCLFPWYRVFSGSGQAVNSYLWMFYFHLYVVN